MFSNKKLAILVVIVMIAPMILSACGPTAEPQVVEKIVTQEVEKEVVVTQEVEKEVVVTQEVEKIVEKIVEVTPTACTLDPTGAWETSWSSPSRTMPARSSSCRPTTRHLCLPVNDAQIWGVSVEQPCPPPPPSARTQIHGQPGGDLRPRSHQPVRRRQVSAKR